MMQGQKDLESVSRLIMSELTPLVSAHHGAFFISDQDAGAPLLKLIASYAYRARKHVANRFTLGEGLVGQAALEKQPILLQNVPDDYIQITSGLGEAPPRNIIVLPILFEGEVKAVIELASFLPFSQIHQSFLDQLSESIGVVLNMIQANMRTEELLEQSQKLTQELQSQSKELQQQQEELKRSNSELEQQARTLRQSEELLKEQQEELQQVNEELEEKASLLAEQNARVEQKNREVESARVALEEKAEQLSLSSKYKNEFLANMSHELRTPLNSLLILAKLLAENKDRNLSGKQVEFAQTIYSSGTDLLNLINDILDLSKVEAGKMEVNSPTCRSPKCATSSSARSGRSPNRSASRSTSRSRRTCRRRSSPTASVCSRCSRTCCRTRSSSPSAATSRSRSVGAATSLRFASRSLDRASDGIIAFAVRDTGVGIPRDKQQLIFEAFQQADGTTSRKFGGTGLGLSISRELARLLGGEIRVESTPGMGSTFTLYLPVVGTERRASMPRQRPSVERTQSTPSASVASPRARSQRRAVRSRGTTTRAEWRRKPRRAAARSTGRRWPTTATTSCRAIASCSRRERQELRGHPPRHGARQGLQGHRRARRRHRARPRARIPPGRDHTRHRHARHGRLGRARSSEAPPGDAAHSGAHHHGNPRAAAGTQGRRDRLPREAGHQGGARGFVQQDRAVHRPAGEAAARRRGRRIQRKSMIELIAHEDVEITAVGVSATRRSKRFSKTRFDCMVLDLGLAGGTDGFQLLETVKSDPAMKELPIIIYTGQGAEPGRRRRACASSPRRSS